MRRPAVILTLLALIWGASFMLIKIADRQLAPATLILGRVGSAEDAAGTAIYLCSRAGAYLTGVIIPVDGGWLAR